MHKIPLILIFLVFTSIFSYSQSFTISGYITDSKNGETLINSSVFDNNAHKGCVTNSYGFYSLTIPKGKVNLLYSYVGYSQQSRIFKLSKDTVINLKMVENTELSEVLVYGNRKELGVQGSQMSAIDVPISQIKSVPTLFGETDVLKALQLLPGVKAGTQGSAGFYVRGGGPDENLILLDGVPVYNVNHMFGFFSVFNADAIKNVTLYKGSFPARFGGRLSSVVDINMNDGNTHALHGNVSIGLISSKFNLEGLLFNENTTFNISARRSYADLLAQPLIQSTLSKQPGMEKTSAGYYFYDVNAKVSHKFSDTDRLYLSVFTGDDIVYANIKQSSTTSESTWLKMDWDWGNIVTALRWNHIISNKLFMNSTAYYTRYNFVLGIGLNTDETTINPASTTSSSTKLGFHSGIEDYCGKVDFDYSPNPNHDIKFGANYTYHTFRPGVTVAQVTGTQQPMDTTIGDENIFTHEAVIYAEDNISINSELKANLGLHYSTFFVQGQFYQSLEPRLSLRYLLSDNFSLKAGYAGMSQYIHLLSNSNIELPTDLWVPVTKRIQPMRSQQVSVGAFYNLMNVLDLSVEAYYKNMDNLIEYKDGASFFGSSTGWEDKVNVGRGWAYGIEFLAQKTIGKTTGWIGYTWSKTERFFDRPGQLLNNGLVFPAKYDRTHDVSIVISHKFSDRFDAAATWVYSTGNAGTLALQNYAGAAIPGTNNASNNGLYTINNLASVPYISSRNNYRYEPTHRLDIGVNFHKKLKHGMRTWNVSVYNAYNQLNPFLTTVRTNSVYNSVTGSYSDVKQLVQISIFPVIPSVSYTYKF
jgi:outer membrane cobalamin receptor